MNCSSVKDAATLLQDRLPQRALNLSLPDLFFQRRLEGDVLAFVVALFAALWEVRLQAQPRVEGTSGESLLLLVLPLSQNPTAAQKE